MCSILVNACYPLFFLNFAFSDIIVLDICTIHTLEETVDNNLGPRARPFSKSKGSRYQDTRLQTSNPLIAQPLSGSPNYAWY